MGTQDESRSQNSGDSLPRSRCGLVLAYRVLWNAAPGSQDVKPLANALTEGYKMLSGA